MRCRRYNFVLSNNRYKNKCIEVIDYWIRHPIDKMGMNRPLDPILSTHLLNCFQSIIDGYKIMCFCNLDDPIYQKSLCDLIVAEVQQMFAHISAFEIHLRIRNSFALSCKVFKINLTLFDWRYLQNNIGHAEIIFTYSWSTDSWCPKRHWKKKEKKNKDLITTKLRKKLAARNSL